MKDIPNYDYVKRYIPNPQVRDVADQFCDAAELLWAQPGVVVPQIINSVLAIELYLKSLIAYSVIKDMQYYGRASGGIVTVERVKSGKTGHELTDLYDLADDWIKGEFESKYGESSIYKSITDFRGCLGAYDSAFVKVRYLYEDSSYFERLNSGELRELMKLIRTTVGLLPRKTVVFK